MYPPTNRFIDLRLPLQNLFLPLDFQSKREKRELRMILACGDGHTGSITNIEAYQKDYDVFCCLYGYNESGFQKNMDYLKNRPDLNIVVSLFDVKNEIEMWKLVDLFAGCIQVIDTDDLRTFLPAGISYRLLTEKGVCQNLTSGKAEDLGYDIPFFIKTQERTFEKQGIDLYQNG